MKKENKLSKTRLQEKNKDKFGGIDAYKELTPIVYGKEAFKYLFFQTEESGKNLFELHWHERMEILRIISGSLELQIGENYLTLHSGEAAVINSRMLHCGYSGSNGVEYHAIMFDVDRLCNTTNVSAKYLSPLCRHEVKFKTVVSEPEVIEQIDRLVDCYKKNEIAGNPLLALGRVYEILGLLYIHSLDQKIELKNVDGEFDAVLEYISKHCCEKLSARTLSEYFNYNETYFCRRFKAITGLTVMNYIKILRMEEAAQLLEKGDEEIGIVARKCGFTDSCYFSNCFRKHFGYSPKTFRRLHRED